MKKLFKSFLTDKLITSQNSSFTSKIFSGNAFKQNLNCNSFLITRFIKTTMKKSFIFFAITVTIVACSKNVSSSSNTFTEDCSTSKSWVTDVEPIIQTYCATNSGCHGSGSTNGPGALLTYTEVYNARAAIRSAVADGSMPKDGTLSNTQKNVILCWIDNGASNN